jgi:hypothetical protein
MDGDGWYNLYLLSVVEKNAKLGDFESEYRRSDGLVDVSQPKIEEFLRRHKIQTSDDESTETLIDQNQSAAGTEAPHNVPKTTLITALARAQKEPGPTPRPSALVEEFARSDSIRRDDKSPNTESATLTITVPVKTPSEQQTFAELYHYLSESLAEGSKIVPNDLAKQIIEEHPKWKSTSLTGTKNIALAPSTTAS